MRSAVLALALLALIVSARTRLTATVLGQPVSIPALWLIAAAVVLALAAMVLWLVRSILRDGGLWIAPRRVGT
ncbi:MAG: hypothetical protein ACRDPY_42245 [Streptosporangiaceae bacterium]